MKHGRHPGCLLNHFNAQLKKFAQGFIIFGKNPLLEVIGGNGLVAGISFVVVCENGRVFLHGFVNNVLNHPTHLSQRQQSKTKHDDGDDGKLPGIVNQDAYKRQRRKDAGTEQADIFYQPGTRGVGVGRKALNDITGIIFVIKRRRQKQQFFK